LGEQAESGGRDKKSQDIGLNSSKHKIREEQDFIIIFRRQG
jgi:hypothetical protein